MLNAQSAIVFSLASLAFGLATNVWVNATFYTVLTPAADIACHYVAPRMMFLALVFAICGVYLQVKRAGEMASDQKQISSDGSNSRR